MNFYFKKYLIFILLFSLESICYSQTFIASDPSMLLTFEKKQFDNQLPLENSIFKPVFYSTDTLSFKVVLKNEIFLNNNSPNQENMDIRYFLLQLTMTRQ